MPEQEDVSLCGDIRNDKERFGLSNGRSGCEVDMHNSNYIKAIKGNVSVSD